MTDALPEPPASLKGSPRAFYDELRQMLAVVNPTKVDTRKTTVQFDDDGVEVEIVHADRDDWRIWATISDRDAIVGTVWTHEHFFPSPLGGVEERPWTTQMVDFIAEILRGEIEIENDLPRKYARVGAALQS